VAPPVRAPSSFPRRESDFLPSLPPIESESKSFPFFLGTVFGL
jgi:hypothetical protein